MEAKPILRALLRAVKRNVAPLNGGDCSAWRDYVLSAFREAKHLSQAEALERAKIAQDYIFIVNNIAHHKDLLVRYRIGMDDGERTKEMVEKTAKRVGFDLPSSQPAPVPES